jgi:hypothetical protein
LDPLDVFDGSFDGDSPHSLSAFSHQSPSRAPSKLRRINQDEYERLSPVRRSVSHIVEMHLDVGHSSEQKCGRYVLTPPPLAIGIGTCN